MTSIRLFEFLSSLGIASKNIIILGDEFDCLTPEYITGDLSASVGETLDTLEIQPSSEVILNGDPPVCIDFAGIAHHVQVMQTIYAKQGRKAFGSFHYQPDTDKVPEEQRGFLHAVNWAVHTTEDGELSLAHYEPQRTSAFACLQPGAGVGGKLRKLTQEEIASCVALIGY